MAKPFVSSRKSASGSARTSQQTVTVWSMQYIQAYQATTQRCRTHLALGTIDLAPGLHDKCVIDSHAGNHLQILSLLCFATSTRATLHVPNTVQCFMILQFLYVLLRTTPTIMNNTSSKDSVTKEGYTEQMLSRSSVDSEKCSSWGGAWCQGPVLVAGLSMHTT